MPRFRMLRAIVILFGLCLPLAVGSVPALASDTTADAVADEAVHTIAAVTLADETGVELPVPTRISPQSPYQVMVEVSDNNLLADIDRVEVVLYYDANGIREVPVLGHPSTATLLTWDRLATPRFALDAGPSTTWTLDDASSVAPSDDASTGTWTFQFTAGDLARETETALDDWKLLVTVTDRNESGDVTQTANVFNNGESTFAVNHYSRLENVTPSISLGQALPGGVLSDTPVIDLAVVANGSYTVEIGVDPTWTGVNGHELTTVADLQNPQEIRLLAKAGQDLASDTTGYGDTNYQAVAATPAPLPELQNAIGPTSETGAPQDIKLAGKFSGEVREDIYQATIYLTISDSNGDS